MSENTRTFDAEVHIDVDDSNNTTSTAGHNLIINSDCIRLMQSRTPSSSGASGSQGEIAWDSDFIYICVGTNSWKRVGITGLLW